MRVNPDALAAIRRRDGVLFIACTDNKISCHCKIVKDANASSFACGNLVLGGFVEKNKQPVTLAMGACRDNG